MSVIFGRFNLDQRPLSPKVGNKILQAASWWKSEDKRIVEEPYVLLGHAMVYNTPESVFEKLPRHNNAQDLIITADARIDNRDELATKLNLANSIDIPDSAFILKAYEKYGQDCVNYLVGAFVFAIWNKKEKRLFCARDHVGVRPFFYYMKDGVFAFGSIQRPILVMEDTDKEINKTYVINQVAPLPQDPQDTAYQHIKSLLPAHTLSVDPDGLSMRQYWDLDIHKETIFKNDEEYVIGFRHHLDEAIKARLRSNKNIGAELSGGLDSSGVCAVAQKHLHLTGKNLHAFSYVLADEDVGKVYPYEGEYAVNSETYLIKELCHKSLINNLTLISESEKKGFVKTIDDFLNLMDGIHQYGHGDFSLLKHAEAQGVNVLLSGFPGDELASSFCRRYYLEYLSNGDLKTYFKQAFDSTNSNVSIKTLLAFYFLKGLTAHFPDTNNAFRKIWRPTISLKKSGRNKLSKSFFTAQYLKDNPDIRESIIECRPESPELNFRQFQRNMVLRPNTSWRMEFQNIQSLPFKAEYRFPLADIRLLQYVLSIPVDQKIKNGQPRAIFRNAMRGLLPESIISRDNKSGSTRPFGHYEYKMIHQERMSWQEEALKDERLNFLDHDKLRHKSNLLLNRDERNHQEAILAVKQNRITRLIRYYQLHPELTIL